MTSWGVYDRTSPALEIRPAGMPGDDAVIPIDGSHPAAIPGHDLALYERCPRRYFYARVFGLAGSWRDGAFVKTHRSIYAVLDWLKEEPPGDFPSRDAAE